ncbi:MAG: hypothetical protein R3D78_04420 [Paracoccaceae bacterium]
MKSETHELPEAELGLHDPLAESFPASAEGARCSGWRWRFRAFRSPWPRI